MDRINLPPDEVLITFNELFTICGIPRHRRDQIRGMTKRGEFPKPIRLSPNRIAWRFSEVEAWKASRPSSQPDKAGRPSLRQVAQNVGLRVRRHATGHSLIDLKTDKVIAGDPIRLTAEDVLDFCRQRQRAVAP